jgi:hypothetical protein
MHHLRHVLGITLALAAAVSCTAILKPDDQAERCGTPMDCSPTGDNRYVPLCVFDEEATGIDSTKVEKICVASYKNIACTVDITVTVDDLVQDCGGTGGYGPCTTAGVFGCPPDVTGCLNGLVVNAYGTCDDENADTPPAIAGSLVNSMNLTSPDILDAFCRGYFCDDEFVCVMGSCVKCDPELPYGMGGCGEIYRDGVLSSVYNSNWNEDECSDASTETAFLGACPG